MFQHLWVCAINNAVDIVGIATNAEGIDGKYNIFSYNMLLQNAYIVFLYVSRTCWSPCPRISLPQGARSSADLLLYLLYFRSYYDLHIRVDDLMTPFILTARSREVTQHIDHYIVSMIWIAFSGIMIGGASYHVQDQNYHQITNISCTLVENTVVDQSDVVGASPVDAAPTTSSFTA